MSATAPTPTDGGEDVDDTDHSAEVEALLEGVADGRVTVERVLEYVRGERDADRLRGEDYLRALNHVRRDLDETLALANIGPDGALVLKVSSYGQIEYRKANAYGDDHRFLGWTEARDMLHRTTFDILTLEDARRRWETAANGGDQ